MHDMSGESKDLLDKIDDWLGRAEAVLLVGIVGLMVGLAAVQFFLRLLFDFGFEWADIMVRHMVLWLGFVGGALATHRGRHIAIDLAQKFLAPERAAWLRTVNALAAAGISAILVRASITFLQDEIDGGATLVGDVPAWPLQAIIPVAFVAISFHFLVSAKNSALIALGKRSPAPQSEEV
jgi:TRAP-type C4-dicarboxylate transport system permease small subunit